MLTAKNLTCIRGGRTLFSHLDFHARPGDIVQIEGDNGSGKTSLLRILCGLSRAEEGDVFWHQQSIHCQRERYHGDLLYLGHQPGMKRTLTACENIRFYHPQCASVRLWQALDEVDLAGFEEERLETLSAGQQRRVALARLWLSEARLWILDEPFTAIDRSGRERLMTRISDHAARGGAVILTTHQPLPAGDRRIVSVHLDTGCGS